MFWDSKKDHTDGSSSDEKGLRRRKLKPELQKLIDQEEDLLDQVYDGSSVDTTETPYRYAAYAARFRTLLLTAHRYVAYTSDIGESFRPVAHPWIVRGAYGISWAYICGDVANEGYKAYVRNRKVLCPQDETFRNATLIPPVESGQNVSTEKHSQQDIQSFHSTASKAHPMPWADPEEDTLTPWSTKRVSLSEDYRSVMAERAVFQALASMGLPALTIHSAVRYSGRALKGVKNNAIRTWGPIGLGLAIVPFLPYVFDEPVEHAVRWSFHTAFRAIGGPDAVPDTQPPPHASEKTLEALEDAKNHKREARAKRRAEREQKFREKQE